MGLNENTDCSRLNGKGTADQAVPGSLSEVLNRRMRLRCVPYPERRRASCAVLRMFSGSAALASGFNGLMVPAQGLALLGRGS
jgi:hypothetical protein